MNKGERFTMTLRFARAGALAVQFEVQELGPRKPHHLSKPSSPPSRGRLLQTFP
jgi:copper(I)-binding protein